VALAIATLALVFAPALLRGDHVPGPREVSAAMLAPTTGDGAAVSSTRMRDDLEIADVLLATLLVAIGIAAVVGSRRRAPESVVLVERARPPLARRRRGPPALLA
jgi:hypothetical protein